MNNNHSKSGKTTSKTTFKSSLHLITKKRIQANTPNFWAKSRNVLWKENVLYLLHWSLDNNQINYLIWVSAVKISWSLRLYFKFHLKKSSSNRLIKYTMGWGVAQWQSACLEGVRLPNTPVTTNPYFFNIVFPQNRTIKG